MGLQHEIEGYSSLEAAKHLTKVLVLRTVKGDRRGFQERTRGIESLRSYLFSTYKRLIRKAINEQRRYASLESLNQDISSDEKASTYAS
jgi:DNA-directed RNA polymerase specialized sigma24 family protein